MTKKCIFKDNNYIKPVEICTFSALNKHFNNSSGNSNLTTIYTTAFINNNIDLNSNFRNPSTNEYIYKYNSGNKKDLCFPLKDNDINSNSPYAINCVIATGNPLYTYDKDKKACTLIPNIQSIPNLIKYSENKDYIYFDNKLEEFNYEYKNIKAYCENKWSDWITIPNYHFGNGYFKDTGDYSKNDVRKCYVPCDKEKLPYIDINGIHKCINKKNADNGIYSKKIEFSPISLINLLGNTKKTLIDLYIYMTLYSYNNYKDKDKNSIFFDVDINKSILNACIVNTNNGKIKESDCTSKPFNNYKEVRDVYGLFSNTIFNNIININTFDIIKNYKYHDNVLTYKNVNFTEEDPELITLRGLINYKVLTYPILIHTFILSYKIYDFTENKIFNIATYFNADNTRIPITDINETKYNVKSILIKILENNDNYKNKTPIIQEQYIQRLANILYKAINICYNNKTEFSKNILIKTKEAFEYYINPKNDTELLNCNKLTFYNNLCFTNNDENYFPTADTTSTINLTELFTNYLNDKVKTGFEISYLTTNDITEKLATIKAESKYTSLESTLKTSIDDFINKYTFYKEELLESNNNCEINKIYDTTTKTCVECGTYCTTDKCSTDNRCKYYCPNVCKDTSIYKNKKTACGDIKGKTQDKNIQNNEYSTPLGEDEIDIFGTFHSSIKSVLGIIFFLIMLYIIYIFYEVFGEGILIFLNFVIYYLRLSFSIIYNGIFNRSNMWNKIDFDMAKYEKSFNINRYNKVVNKINTKV
jgi:hypothetical protein